MLNFGFSSKQRNPDEWATNKLRIGDSGANEFGYVAALYGALVPDLMGVNFIHSIIISDLTTTAKAVMKVGSNGNEQMLIHGQIRLSGFARLGDFEDILVLDWDEVNLYYKTTEADIGIFEYFRDNVDTWIPIGGIATDSSYCYQGKQLNKSKCSRVKYKMPIDYPSDTDVLMGIDIYTHGANGNNPQGLVNWGTMYQGGSNTVSMQMAIGADSTPYIRYRDIVGKVVQTKSNIFIPLNTWTRVEAEIVAPFTHVTFRVGAELETVPLYSTIAPQNVSGRSVYVSGIDYYTSILGYWKNAQFTLGGTDYLDAPCDEIFGDISLNNGLGSYGVIELLQPDTHFDSSSLPL